MRLLVYSIKRIFLLIPILVGISVVTFMITHVLPGDPIYIILSPYATTDDVAAARVRLGLDKPLYVQYGVYLESLVHGDLGYSYRTRNPVAIDLADRFPATFELITISLLIAVAIGIPLGVQAATHKDSWFDHIVRVVSVAGVSIPIFWTSIVLVYFLYFKWHIFPPPLGRLGIFDIPPKTITGMYTVDALLEGNWVILKTSLYYMIMPVIALVIAMLAPIMRVTRNSTLEVLQSNFIRTANSLGLPSRTVIYKDALRNALLPVITNVGMMFGWSLGGEVLVEVVFSWPGMGNYAVNSILNMDFAPIQGYVLLTATIYVVVNLIADLLYTVVDPRITY
jgi:ABC-type dipeptide/oligopeptide/nickel transport system permease component